jgi:hypothetical protein
MTKPYTFRALIESEESGGAFVTIPFDVEQEFGKKRVKVKATIDGEPYRGSLVRMGSPSHMLLVLKEIRSRIEKGPGDEVLVIIEEDLDPRTVEVPPDFQAALDGDPQASSFFQEMSYTHRRETVRWIESARREQTRRERIEKAVALLRQEKPPRE